MLSSLVCDVGVRDPATYLGVAAFLWAVALVASWIPGRHAAGADPAAALRSE